MAAKIEFRSTRELSQFKQLIFDLRYALGFSKHNKGIIEIEQVGDDEVFNLVLNFPLTVQQEQLIKLILHSGNYEVYWSELYS